MNRRELLRGLALGGTVIAGELWIPGKKLISIPKPLPRVEGDFDISALRYFTSEKWYIPDRFAWVKVWQENGVLHVMPITHEEIYI